MAKLKISDYSSTSAGANLNTDINSIDIDEGCAPSGINNAIRTLMAQVKDFQTGVSGDGLTLGGALSGTSATFSGNVTASAISGASMTLSGDLTVDTNTLYVDATNNNVGIGTTSPNAKLHIHGGDETTANIDTSSASNIVLNVAGTTGAAGSGGAMVFSANDGAWRFAAIKGLVVDGANNTAGDLAFSVRNATTDSTLSEAMRIKSNGNVGIGTSSPSSRLHLKSASGTTGELIVDNSNASDESRVHFYNNGSGKFRIDVDSSPNMKFIHSGVAERMRIDSSGNVLVGTTTSALANNNSVVVSPSSGVVVCSHLNGTASGTAYGLFTYNGGPIGSITQNGTTAVAYNTSSDYRLKENVAPMSNSIDRLKQLKPSTWSWTQDGSHGEGFLAHEAQIVVPEAVTGTKDAVDDDGNPVYQGIDQSKLVPLLTAALQEAITKIEDLEKRIQTLENQ